MIKLLFLFVVITSVLFNSCTNSNVNNKHFGSKFETIEINNSNYQTTIPLSDFVRKIRFLPLETTPNCLITEITKLIETEKEIFIFDRPNNCVLKFTKDGKLIGKIDQEGKGPGEYLHLVDIEIEGNRLLLLDYSSQRVKCYNSDRLSYINDFIPPVGAVEMKAVQGKLLFYCGPLLNEDKPSICFCNNDGSMPARLIDSKYAQTAIKTQGSSVFCGEELFSRPFESSLYSLNNNLLLMKYKIDFGSRGMPEMTLHENYNLFDKNFIYYYRYKTYDCNKILLFDFFKTDEKIKRVYCLYDKDKKKSIWGPVKNDIIYQSSLPFYPGFSNSKSLIGIFQPEIFINKNDKEIAPELKMVKIGDNPILVYYDL